MNEPSDEMLKELFSAIDTLPAQYHDIANHLVAALIWLLYPQWFRGKMNEETKERIN